MKTITLTLVLSMILIFSCSKEEDIDNDDHIIVVDNNKLLLLKVDYLSYQFEGGTELNFDSDIHGDSVPMIINYVAPGDFGGITILHEPSNDSIFGGTIIWMGLGERVFPETLLESSDFNGGQESIFAPLLEDVQFIDFDSPGFGSGPTTVVVEAIWSSISGLEAVEYYINQGAHIAILKYTPGVGIGDPADWDWYVMLYL